MEEGGGGCGGGGGGVKRKKTHAIDWSNEEKVTLRGRKRFQIRLGNVFSKETYYTF